METDDLKYIPVTYWLLGILVVVFVIEIVTTIAKVPFIEVFILNPEAIINGQQLWGIFTNMFLHGGPFHLLFNGWALWMFGLALERIVGSKNILKIFLISGLFASIFYVLTSVFILDMRASALGASGAIFGVIGAMIALRPRMRVMLLFPPVPMQLWMLGVFFVLIAVYWFGIGGGTGIAENAHLGGLMIGLLMGLYFKRRESTDPDHDWKALYT